MRPRKEIEEAQWTADRTQFVKIGEGARILEVLLDIRDLLASLEGK